MTLPSDADPDADAAVAVSIAELHGATVARIETLPGVVNTVVRVVGDGCDWVVRFPVDRRRLNEFPMELWIARQVVGLGIATPEVVATGHLDDRPYMVTRYSSPAKCAEPSQMWRWLGHYSALLTKVPLDDAPEGLFSRFGRDLPSAWQSHVNYNLTALTDDDPLIEDGVYQRAELDELRALLTELQSTNFAFGLAHGDLAPRNLIYQAPPASPVLIDWGTATTGPAPWTDLQRIYAWAVHDQTISVDALRWFSDAAGLPLGPMVLRTLNQLTALRYLDLARWASGQPDRYDEYRSSSKRGLQTVLSTTT